MGAWRRLRPGRALAAVALVAALATGCSAFDEQQRRWVFQPGSRTWAGGQTAAQFQDVWIDFTSEASGAPVRLHGLWLPQPDPNAPRLLYLHGAKWDVRSSAARIGRMQALGFAVLAIDYRGFGDSTAGLPSEDSAVEDARAAWDWLGAKSPGLPRYVFGHSLGGAIAVQLAAGREDVAGLMVEGTFTSIPDVFRTMQWGWLPLGPFITQRFDSLARIRSVKAPVLVVHGSDDQLIKPELGRRLYEEAPSPKRFVLVDGGSHHNTNAIGQSAYRAAVGELFGLP